MRVRWFGGDPWAPACTPEAQVSTPVGTKCLECAERIGERDRGFVTACSPGIWGSWELELDDRVYVVCSYHLSCFLAIVEGGNIEGTRVAERMHGATSMKVQSIMRENDKKLREPTPATEDAKPGRGWKK